MYDGCYHTKYIDIYLSANMQIDLMCWIAFPRNSTAQSIHKNISNGQNLILLSTIGKQTHAHSELYQFNNNNGKKRGWN